jgi:prepilin-type N-terminal cleavage/methylation domain-containing protein
MTPASQQARPGGTVAGEDGFTLVEVLLALAVAGVVLAASYGWVWSLGAFARVHDDRAQAGTIAAAAARGIADDVRAAVAVAPPSAVYDPSRALKLVHDHVGAAPEEVTIVWDPVRRVIWRNAPGTYVADHVTAFVVAYTLRDGREVGAAAMVATDWPLATAVLVSLSTEAGRARASRIVLAQVGA